MQTRTNPADAAVISNDDPYILNQMAVAWPAIIAGAFTAAAVSLILLFLGSGIGLASVSPWANAGVSGITFTATAAIWMIIMQWVASGLGGYLTGRLRSKWVNMHTDEVFFRDTAHGFLAWVLATVFTAILLSSTITSVISGGAKAVTTVAAVGVGQAAAQKPGSAMEDNNAYFIDSLFRSQNANANMPVVPPVSQKETREEATRIIMMGMKNGDVSQEDRAYLAQLVANRTGLSQPDAGKRVNDVITQIKDEETKLKQAADTARKTASTIALFTFLSLLIGAFIASASAALGGQHRDEY